MKRFLTLPEQNYTKIALEFYGEHGPIETVVGSHAGSYPNNPAKSVLMADRKTGQEIIQVITGDPGDHVEWGDVDPSEHPYLSYKAMIEAYLGEQFDDLYDRLALMKALGEFLSGLADDTRKIYRDQES